MPEICAATFDLRRRTTWLDRGDAGGDLMQLNGWSTRQMLTWYGASAAGVRARRSYNLYCFITRRRCGGLRFGRMSWLRRDHGLCPFACSTWS